MSTKKVIDISKWNPVADYEKAAKEIQGVIIRCGYRGLANGTLTKDPLFTQHITSFHKLGVPVGIYFFTTALNATEAKAEADYAISLVESLGIKVSFPIAIDTEYSNNTHTGRSDNLSKDERTSAVVAFCERVKEKGYEPMIYASDSWFNYRLNYEEVKEYKKWVADYSGSPEFATYNMIAHQYGKDTISGIAKPVDDNYWYGEIGNETKPADKEEPNAKLVTGAKITLKDVNCYASSTTAKVSSEKTGVFYIWSDSVRSGRIRITNKPENVGKNGAITGWVNAADLDGSEPVLANGVKITLNNVNCYNSSVATKVSSVKTGTYYIWSANVIKGRIRITNKKENVGKANAVTGWINVKDL